MRSTTDRHRDDGAISIMAAVLVLAVLVATSLAVDVGRTAFVSRDQQGVTDRAALDAMTVVNSAANVGITELADLHDAVEDAVETTLGRNPGTDGGTAEDRTVNLVGLGRVHDGAFEKMCEEPYDQTVGATCNGDVDGDGVPEWEVADVSAVRVVTESFVPFVFAVGDAQGGRPVIREAVAESQSLASITVGSELAGIEGGLVEDVLNDTICSVALNAGGSGCSLDISAAGYQGLATTDIRLGALVQELSMVVGSPDAVLTSDITAAHFITAAANVLDNQGRTDQAQVLEDIVLELPTDQLEFNLLDVVDLSTTTPGRAADATVNVLEVVRGSLQVANGTNLLDLPDLSAQLPAGLGGMDGSMTVIESPSTAVGPVGDGTVTRAHTGQVMLDTDSEVTLDLVDDVEDALEATTLDSVDVTMGPVNLPLGAEAAGATASLTDILCDVTPEPDTEAQTSTDVARLVIGHLQSDGTLEPADLADLTVTLRDPLLGLPVLEVDLDVDAEVELPVGGATGPEWVFDASQFTGEDPDENQKTYPRGPHHTGGSILDTGDLNATNVDLTVSSTYTVLGALPMPIGDLLDLIVETVEDALVASLLPVITDTVGTVVDPLLESLGVGLGNADTWANWAHCSGRELAWVDPDA